MNDSREIIHDNERLKLFDSLRAVAIMTFHIDNPVVQQTLLKIARVKGIAKARKAYNRVMRVLKSTPQYIALATSKFPFECPPEKLIGGTIPIGYVRNHILDKKYLFGLNLNELNQHILICGRSGAGKTTLILSIVRSLIDLDLPFLIADFKDEFSCTAHFADDLYIFKLKDFRFNPLVAPDNTDQTSWNQIFADTFFEIFFTPPVPLAAKAVFLDILCSLTANNKKLSLKELDGELDKLLANPKISPSYKQRLNTFHVKIKLLLKLIDSTFSSSFKNIAELLTAKKVVLKLQGLSVEIQSFLITILFHYIFIYRLKNHQNNTLKHFLIFDEAKMVFSADQASASSQISRVLSTMRGPGECLIVGEQMPSCLGHGLLANVYTQICLSLSSQKDIQYMSYAMGLDDEQRKMLNSLKLKTGICKLADRYVKPFIFHIPHIEIDKNISDSEIQAYMAPKLASLELMHEAEKMDNPEPEVQAKADVDAENEYTELGEENKIVLKDFKMLPFLPQSERCKRLKFTTYMFGKICNSLLEKGFIEELRVKINDTRGPSVKLHCFTQKAEALLGSQCLGSGHGGFLHRFWQNHHKELASKHGYMATIEKCINSKSVDVFLKRNDEDIAIEIAITHYEKEITNIQKNISVGIKNIWVLASTQKMLDSIEADWLAVKSEYPSDISVEFYLLSDSKMYSSMDSQGKGGESVSKE